MADVPVRCSCRLGVAATLLVSFATGQRGTHEDLILELARLRRIDSVGWKDVESVRAKARRAERIGKGEGAAESRAWIRLAGVRSQIHQKILAVIGAYERRFREDAKGWSPDRYARFAKSCVPIVSTWIAMDSPSEVRREIVTRLPILRAALRFQSETAPRRQLLMLTADRLSNTPGKTDLEDLSELVGWAALFHEDEALGTPQLRAVTADLIVVLTERDEGGVRVSKQGYYRSGRFRDSGFGCDVRDGGDQVRHFIWALHAMARSPNLAATQQILNLKELRDAATRGEPVKTEDLTLNARAREIVETMLGAGVDVPESERAPISILEMPGLVQKVLGR